MVVTLLTVGGLIFLGMAALNVSSRHFSSIGMGLFLICLAQYGPGLLKHLH